MSVRSLLQQALDASLSGDKVYSHWTRKSDVQGENEDEYIVYTVDSDFNTFWSDNHAVIRNANPVVRYYYAMNISETNVADREKQIETALESAGFTVTNIFDAGDIDEVGMNTTVFECSYSRVIDG